jgi:hypothetical protein
LLANNVSPAPIRKTNWHNLDTIWFRVQRSKTFCVTTTWQACRYGKG